MPLVVDRTALVLDGGPGLRSQPTERGHSTIPPSQSAGMPFSPTVAPATPPTTAPVVSASPPRLTARSTASSKLVAPANAHTAASSVWTT